VTLISQVPRSSGQEVAGMERIKFEATDSILEENGAEPKVGMGDDQGVASGFNDGSLDVHVMEKSEKRS
jgi:hypothetical protein